MPNPRQPELRRSGRGMITPQGAHAAAEKDKVVRGKGRRRGGGKGGKVTGVPPAERPPCPT